jgi:hypothetical protein
MLIALRYKAALNSAGPCRGSAAISRTRNVFVPMPAAVVKTPPVDQYKTTTAMPTGPNDLGINRVQMSAIHQVTAWLTLMKLRLRISLRLAA